MFAKVLLAVFTVIILDIEGAKIPSFVPLCKRNDPNLNECYLNTFNVVLKRLGKGIPEMRLRKFEPVILEKITVLQEGSSLALDAELSNTKVHGLTSGTGTSANVDLEKLTFEISMEVPRIYMESDYVGKGKLLSIVFESKGTFNGNMTGITAKGLWSAEKEVKNGKSWVRNFKNEYLTLDIKDIKMYFDNLIPNKQINDETNRAINENIDLLYKDVSPIIKSTIKTVLADAAGSVYSTFSLEEMFPE